MAQQQPSLQYTDPRAWSQQLAGDRVSSMEQEMKRLAVQAQLQQYMQQMQQGQGMSNQSSEYGGNSPSLSSKTPSPQASQDDVLLAKRQRSLDMAKLDDERQRLALEAKVKGLQAKNLKSQASASQFKQEAWMKALAPYTQLLGQDPNSMSIAQRADPRLGTAIDAGYVWSGQAEPWKRSFSLSNSTGVGLQNAKTTNTNYSFKG